jgi:hypothetical protein
MVVGGEDGGGWRPEVNWEMEEATMRLGEESEE